MADEPANEAGKNAHETSVAACEWASEQALTISSDPHQLSAMCGKLPIAIGVPQR
jgi:hypothetical protein